uniref:Uncharacterized protein n=1 Tax=Anguilla anguilla TaxID=7936 RepID=A0A0E9T7G2_ANGAN
MPTSCNRYSAKIGFATKAAVWSNQYKHAADCSVL